MKFPKSILTEEIERNRNVEFLLEHIEEIFGSDYKINKFDAIDGSFTEINGYRVEVFSIINTKNQNSGRY